MVTSELAKGAAKASCENKAVESKASFGRIFKLSALSLLLLDVTGIAYAAIPEGTVTRTAGQAVAIGSGSWTDAPGRCV